MLYEFEQRQVGFLLVLGAVLAWSTAGLFVRLIELDSWSILFWRGLFASLALALALAALRGPRAVLAAARRSGAGALWLVAGCDVLASVTYIGALNHTSVADVAVIYATAPLTAALLGWLCLRERPGVGLFLAGALAGLGVAVTVVGADGAGGERSLLGVGLAAAMTLAMATMALLARARPQVDTGAAALLSALVTTALAAPFAAGADAAAWPPDPVKLGWLALFGALQMALGLLLFLLGSRRLPPGEALLLTLLDAPLAPLWVWMAFGEAPTASTALGGAMVAGAVALHLAVARRTRVPGGRPAAPALAVEHP